MKATVQHDLNIIFGDVHVGIGIDGSGGSLGNFYVEEHIKGRATCIARPKASENSCALNSKLN
jgi:hypothetical protein